MNDTNCFQRIPPHCRILKEALRIPGICNDEHPVATLLSPYPSRPSKPNGGVAPQGAVSVSKRIATYHPLQQDCARRTSCCDGKRATVALSPVSAICLVLPQRKKRVDRPPRLVIIDASRHLAWSIPLERHPWCKAETAWPRSWVPRPPACSPCLRDRHRRTSGLCVSLARAARRCTGRAPRGDGVHATASPEPPAPCRSHPASLQQTLAPPGTLSRANGPGGPRHVGILQTLWHVELWRQGGLLPER